MRLQSKSMPIRKSNNSTVTEEVVEKRNSSNSERSYSKYGKTHDISELKIKAEFMAHHDEKFARIR